MKTEKLEKLSPCKEAIAFCRQFKTYKEAWQNCERGDWMLWLAARLKVDERKLFLASGKCAETVIHLMKDQRSRDGVQAAIDYGNGLINKNQLENAAYAAASAADAAYAAAYAAYAADAADAAAYAASAADAAYAAFAAAAYAAYAAYDAASAATSAAAKKNNQLLTANICREILTDAVFAKYKRL